MEVICERCKTLYEFDETLISPRGTKVRCTQCGHMFRVFSQQHTNTGASLTPEAWIWHLKWPDGKREDASALSVVQEMILTGRVTEDVLISRGPDAWKRIGDIAEFNTALLSARERKRADRLQDQAHPTHGDEHISVEPGPYAHLNRETSGDTDLEFVTDDETRVGKLPQMQLTAASRRESRRHGVKSTLQYENLPHDRTPRDSDTSDSERSAPRTLSGLSLGLASNLINTEAPNVTVRIGDDDLQPTAATSQRADAIEDDDLRPPMRKSPAVVKWLLLAAAFGLALLGLSYLRPLLKPFFGSTHPLKQATQRTATYDRRELPLRQPREQVQSQTSTAADKSSTAPTTQTQPIAPHPESADEANTQRSEPKRTNPPQRTSKQESYDDLLRQGKHRMSQKQLAAAEEAFRKALAARPGSLEPMVALGDIATFRKQPAQALAYFTAAQSVGEADHWKHNPQLKTHVLSELQKLQPAPSAEAKETKPE